MTSQGLALLTLQLLRKIVKFDTCVGLEAEMPTSAYQGVLRTGRPFVPSKSFLGLQVAEAIEFFDDFPGKRVFVHEISPWPR